MIEKREVDASGAGVVHVLRGSGNGQRPHDMWGLPGRLRRVDRTRRTPVQRRPAGTPALPTEAMSDGSSGHDRPQAQRRLHDRRAHP